MERIRRMHDPLRIAVVGDYSPEFPPHVKTNEAFEHAADALGVSIDAHWIPTRSLDDDVTELARCNAVLVSPGAPYKSMTGVLNSIRYCRQTGVLLLGTCGGCQHVAIEFAQNVLKISDAAHAENDPYASKLIITPLSCSLRGLTMEVEIEPGSRLAKFYGAT